MEQSASIQKIKYFMFALNVSACLFIMAVINSTSYTVCAFGKASEFLAGANCIPLNPAASFAHTLIVCTGFFITFLIRRFISVQKTSVFYTTFVIDIILNMLLLKTTNCNYNGFMLYLLANIIDNVEKSWRYPAMIFGIFIYMLSSYELVNSFYPLFSVRSYMLFYPHSISRTLLFIFYTLCALNMISFTVFCIKVIQEQKGIIDEKNKLYGELKKANEKLKEYADIKEKMGQTKERNRLAMEIHDSVGHSLTGISVGVDTCLAIMDKNPAAAKTQLQVISGVAKDGIADIRRSVSTLRSDSGTQTPLDQNIKNMIEKTKRATGIEIQFICYVHLCFGEDEENAIFRIIQESVTNAIRHGKATKIVIVISSQNDNLEIVVSDNGCGCKNLIDGFGITHMKERIALLHGSIGFISHNGFTVEALLPLREKQND